ncbi:unnamed protein product [Ectocarpus sp. 13 AM-2016]
MDTENAQKFGRTHLSSHNLRIELSRQDRTWLSPVRLAPLSPLAATVLILASLGPDLGLLQSSTVACGCLFRPQRIFVGPVGRCSPSHLPISTLQPTVPFVLPR